MMKAVFVCYSSRIIDILFGLYYANLKDPNGPFLSNFSPNHGMFLVFFWNHGIYISDFIEESRADCGTLKVSMNRVHNFM